MKLTNLELLAALENLRLTHPEDDDYLLLVASAIVAQNLGYAHRAQWTEKLRETGLVEYDALCRQDAAEKNYERLMEKLDAEAPKCNTWYCAIYAGDTDNEYECFENDHDAILGFFKNTDQRGFPLEIYQCSNDECLSPQRQIL